MQHLLQIHLGPVQEFIATARRSRDLWYGSWLLSELAKAAAKAIFESEGSLDSLIFPCPVEPVQLEPNSSLNVANKVVALVENDPAKIAKELVRPAVNRRLQVLCDDAFSRIRGPYRQEIARNQVNDLIEFFWVSTPLSQSEDYDDVRRYAESIMAARKSTRDFDVPSWGSDVPKSSLDGSRESVIDEDNYPNRVDNLKIREQKITRLYQRYGARSAERLSGVDLLKRHGNRGEESRFPSTSHISALPLLLKLGNQDGIEKHWNELIEKLSKTNLQMDHVPEKYSAPVFKETDGSVLFPSRLAESLEGAQLKDAKNCLANFLMSTVNGEQPIPYYALLLADGDYMGAVINAQKSIRQHQQFSKTLNEFAGDVREIVEDRYQGALVYAGGDDVLAFLPLHTALACANSLASLFREKMKNFHDADRKSPTFSAGIAVNHHLEPLADALALAREAESLAKSVPGKDALAIAIDKRSGVTRAVAGKWGQIDQRVDRYIDFYRRDAFPSGAAYELRGISYELGGEKYLRSNENMQEVMRAEALRILSRKRSERGTRRLAKEVQENINKSIKVSNQSIEQLADELIIAQFFARAFEQALGPVLEEDSRDNLDH